ncbi:MAG: hypothetical protein NTW93_00885 [Phycisphaerae bacterium]|nr:hypothetical protein [Phycisphaerae bacterium]
MPIVNFPFFKTSPNHPNRPILFVKIVNPQTGLLIDTTGMIDTGADACAVPAYFAKYLGYDLKSGIRKGVNTGNGATNAYSHICRLEVYNTNSVFNGNPEIIYTTSEVQIDFMERLPVVLLGVSDFLGQFFLGVDYPSQLFSVRSP